MTKKSRAVPDNRTYEKMDSTSKHEREIEQNQPKDEPKTLL